MNILFVGDVVGQSSCRDLTEAMPALKKRFGVDAVIVNGENSADGNGITPHSADGILQCLHRANRAFYSSVDNAYFPIEDKFIEYAKSVLGEDYDKVRALDLRTTCFIAYVLSLDFSRRKGLDREEILRKAYSYDEFVNGKLPHY